MTKPTAKLTRAMMTIRELPVERQEELAEALLQYAERYCLPVIR